MQKLGINPWLTIWTNPKKTIRAVADYEPRKGFFVLASIFVMNAFFFFTGYATLEISYRFTLAIVIALVLSPIIGSIWFYFFGWILYFTGRWLKGTAPAINLRVSFAWSKAPLMITLLMWFILLVFAKDYLFMQFNNSFAFTFINIISLISGIWSLVILIQGVKEVQRFTLLRAILNVALAYLCLYIIVFFSIFFARAFLYLLGQPS